MDLLKAKSESSWSSPTSLPVVEEKGYRANNLTPQKGKKGKERSLSPSKGGKSGKTEAVVEEKKEPVVEEKKEDWERVRSPGEGKAACTYQGSWGYTGAKGKGDMGAIWGKGGKENKDEKHGKKPMDWEEKDEFRIIVKDNEGSKDPNSGLEHEMWVNNSALVQETVHNWRTKHLKTEKVSWHHVPYLDGEPMDPNARMEEYRQQLKDHRIKMQPNSAPSGAWAFLREQQKL